MHISFSPYFFEALFPWYLYLFKFLISSFVRPWFYNLPFLKAISSKRAKKFLKFKPGSRLSLMKPGGWFMTNCLWTWPLPLFLSIKVIVYGWKGFCWGCLCTWWWGRLAPINIELKFPKGLYPSSSDSYSTSQFIHLC